MYLNETNTTDAPAKTSWIDSLMAMGQGALALKQQRDIQSINTERLRQGLAPIDASDVAVGAKVAMDKAQLNKILLVTGGGIALIAIVLLLRRR